MSSLLLLLVLNAQASPPGMQLVPEEWRPRHSQDGPIDSRRIIEHEFNFDEEDLPLLDDNGCPRILTDDQCDDPAFWQSFCGAEELTKPESLCQDAFWDYAESVEGALPLVPVVDTRTGEITVVRFEAYDPARVTWSGFTSTYAPHLFQLTHPRNSLEPWAAALELTWWDTNCSVQSCAELAYETYQDYSEFEARTASALGQGDWRTVVDAAYSSDGIARKTLRSRTGVPLSPLTLTADRSTYLTGFRSGQRGPLYGWSPGEDARSVTSSSFRDQAGFDEAAAWVPFLLHFLDEIPPAALDDTTLVNVDVVQGFLDHCAFSDDTGLLVCDGGATATGSAIAQSFNALVRPYDAALTSQIPEQSPWPTAGQDAWDFHQSMADSLAFVDDDKLLWLEDRQEDFAQLTQSRRRALTRLKRLAEIHTFGEVLCLAEGRCTDVGPALERALAELDQIDQDITALVTVFSVSDCFGGAPTPCDWSPRWPGLSLVDHYQSEREALFAECITRTGDDFSVLRDDDPDDGQPFWLIQQDADLDAATGFGICDTNPAVDAPGPECRVRGDYLSNERSVLEYFDTVDAWGNAFFNQYDFPVDPDSGLPTIAGSKGDRSAIGDSDFGASFEYSAGWDLPELANLPCGLGAQAHGQLRVGTRIFGQTIPPVWSGDAPNGITNPSAFERRREEGNLVFADLMVDVGNEAGATWAVFDLLGVQLYSAVDTDEAESDGTLTWHYVAQPEPVTRSVDLLRVSQTAFIGPVPVNLQVGVVGQVGYTARAQIDADRCPADAQWAQVGATARFTPFAQANAVASASAGISGLASIGVEANLTIVKVELPLDMSVAATWDPDRLRPTPTGSDTGLDVSADVTLETTLLSGRIRGFVEVLFKKYARTLFRFDGWRYDQPLLELALSADLTGIRSALGLSGPADPPPPHGTSVQALHDDRGECASYERPEPDVYVDFDDENLSSTTLAAAVGSASWDVSQATTGQVGRHGQAISGPFTAQTGHVFPLGDGLTYSLSFNPDGDTSGTLLAHGTGGGPGGLTIRLDEQSQLAIEMGCSEGGTRVTSDVETLDPNAWHHVFVSVQPNGQGTLAWVDGRFMDWIQGCSLSFAGTTVHLGHLVRNGTVSDPFTGRLDEFAYWGSNDLSGFDAADLLAQAQAGLPVTGSGVAPLSGLTALDVRLDGETVAANWTNPASIQSPGFGYDQVVVRVGVDGYPAHPTDGSAGYSGTAENASLTVPSGVSSVYVSSWAIGPAGTRPGPRTQVSQTAVAIPNVTNLTAQPGRGEVRLRWSLPTDPRVHHVRVVRNDTPPTHENDGQTVANARTTDVLDVGLHDGQTVHYTVWTVDGIGRKSSGVSISATPTVVSVLDLTPPGPVTHAIAEALPTKTALSWTLPDDDDPLTVDVRRVEGGILRQPIGRVSGEGLTDSTALVGVRNTYELTVYDNAGNRSPTVSIHATQLALMPPVGLQASDANGSVTVSWAVADPEASSVRVVRTTNSAATTPSTGILVCDTNVPLTQCTDDSPPIDQTLFYTAFSVHPLGSLSVGVADSVRLEAPVGHAGPDRLVHVGERVVLTANNVSTSAPATWDAGSTAIVDDRGLSWFLAKEPGTITVALSAQDTGGSPITDEAEITVVPYTGGAVGWSSNPFNELLHPDVPFSGIAVTDTEIWALTSDSVVGVSPDGSVVGELLGDFEAMVGHTGDFLVFNTPNQPSSNAQIVDISDPTSPQLTSSRSRGTRTHPTVAGGRLAFSRCCNAVDVVTLFSTGELPLVSIPYSGFIRDVALSDDGTLVAIGLLREVLVYDISAPAATLDTPDAVLATASNVRAIAFDGNDLWVAEYNFPSGTANRYDLTDLANPVEDASVAFVQDNVQRLKASGEHLLLVGGSDVQIIQTNTADGAAPVIRAPYELIGDAALFPPANPTTLLTSPQSTSSPEMGLWSTPLGAPSPHYTPQSLDSAISIADGVASSGPSWIQVQGGFGAAGTATGPAIDVDLGFTSAPFDIARMLCLDDDVYTYVGDPAGLGPHVIRSRIGDGNTPLSQWEVPSDCTAMTCTDANVVGLCDGELRAFDKETGSVNGTLTAPTLPTPTLRSTPHGDRVLVVDGSDVWGATIPSMTPLSAQPLTFDALPFFQTWIDDTIWGTQSRFLSRWAIGSGVTEPVSATALSDYNTDDLVYDVFDERLITSGSGAMRSVRPESATQVAGVWGGANGQELVADGGFAFANLGAGLVVVDTATVFTHGPAGTVASGETVVVDVSWQAPLAAECAGDCSLEPEVLCEVSAGTCEVTAINTTLQTASVSWTLPIGNGQAELAVAVGTPRWFDTAFERVSVE